MAKVVYSSASTMLSSEDGERDRVSVMIDDFKQQDAKYSSGERRDLANRLSEEATYGYRTGDFEMALERFARHLALCEKGYGDNEGETLKPGLICNIGSCLHLLGEMDLARVYYDKAREVFSALAAKHAKRGRVYKFVMDDFNASRVKYIDNRIALLEINEKPDTTKYLDGMGKMRTWQGEPTPPPPPPKPYVPPPPGPSYPLRSYVSVKDWKAWYRGDENDGRYPEGSGYEKLDDEKATASL